ncbi:Omega-6 fatty acid desaturase, endoplasmic reticulum isozyme 2 [Pseudolycoriella hygida]|uniref:Omega-6 fatty acid desaturase, endoplasmic reticulum isozyme 2 n=1 Tax=Pseudolycoriella hygida TaxID=35572 RepID=A0A9Q0S3Z1_9DIPT|nr:Omega-6 fatty acid desaturase, endoplasmic reticulum isozyme 2 [Pseudolycoriella hygida]
MSSVENPSVKCRNDYEELKKAGYEYVDGTIVPQPFSPPQFTLTELRNAVPAHCFERNTLKSFGYLIFDLLLVTSLFCCAYFVFEQRSLPLCCQFFGYLTYWFLQGSVLLGIWVIGHECGHSAFSESDLVNDTVGFIVHSALLTPYYSFKFSHRKHHSNTGSCENDMLFVPFTEDDVVSTWSETLQDSPWYHAYQLGVMVLFGWMPLYLGRIVWGPKKYKNKPKCHFNPKAAFFLPKERQSIVLSDVGFVATVVIIGYFICTCGFPIVLRLYIVPYAVMNAYLLIVTYLHHTDIYVPHFREGEWSWLRGTLCTVDRSYGKFFDVVFHHLNDTHVCHHIFSKMPFYHCVEATEALKPILGDYYLKDTTPFYLALWRVVTHCQYVQNDGTVVFHKRKLVKSK